MSISQKVIIHPYASAEGNSLLEWLIREFESERWTQFQGAVAFLNRSGNFDALLTAMQNHAERGNTIALTFGSDVFKGGSGSDYDALMTLLNRFDDEIERVQFHLYHERGRTFHPKLYLFSNTDMQRAVLSIGSSNWSRGGLLENVEANLILGLDLAMVEDNNLFSTIQNLFETYWTQSQSDEEKAGVGFARAVNLQNVERFKALLSTPNETTDDSGQSSGSLRSINPEIEEAESIFGGERITIPKTYRRKVVRYTSPKIDPVLVDEERGKLVWRKKMAASDVQRQQGKPTGGIRLTQAKFEVDGAVINQTMYFRDDVFGALDWSIGRYTPKKREVALVQATITILGETYGQHQFKVSHKPTGEAGQGNYTTLLHWWGLSDLIKGLDLTGKRFELFAPPSNDWTEPFHIEIS